MLNKQNINRVFSQPIFNLNKIDIMETKIGIHPYEKEAVEQHIRDVVSGHFPLLNMTPENENQYVDTFLKGVKFGLTIGEKIFNEVNDSYPTLFLQGLSDEPKEESKIVLDEENARTLHY